MFNVGGPEVLVILLVALVVLGPQQLPKAVRSVGNVMSELRRMSSGFQDEIRSALDVSTEADARKEGAKVARRPEDADITEVVARHPEGFTDVDANGPLPGTEGPVAGYDAAQDPHTAATRPVAPSADHDAEESWIPSDRASG